MKHTIARLASLLAAAGFASPAFAQLHPNDLEFDLTPVNQWVLQEYYDDIRGVAVDADHNVFVTGDIALQKFTFDGTRLYFKLHGDGFLFRPDGVAVDANGSVYVVNTYDHGVHVFAPDGTFVTAWHGGEGGDVLGSPFGIAAGSPGFLAVRTAGHVDSFDSDGNLLDVWASGGGSGVAVGDHDDVYTAANGLIYRYDRKGNLRQTMGPSPYPDGQFLGASGLAVDGDGFVYVGDGSRLLRVFDAAGNFRGYFGNDDRIQGVALDDRGYVYLVGGRMVRVFGPLPELPPPPPPPPAEIAPSVMLHLSTPVASGACGQVPADVHDIVTSGDASSEGIPYFVYLLMRTGSGTKGLSGLQLGIDYHGMGNGTALAMNHWASCSDLEFPTDDWPAAGSGNTLTWVAPENCQMQPIVAAGYFYVTAYASATMSVDPHPASGRLKVAVCTATEVLPDQTLGLDQVGWVSMGRGALGTDTNGCNPAMEPCLRGSVPTRPTTWGKIKTLYKN